LVFEKLVDGLISFSYDLLDALDLLLLTIHLLIKHANQLVLLNQFLLDFFITSPRLLLWNIEIIHLFLDMSKSLINVCSNVKLHVLDHDLLHLHLLLYLNKLVL